MPCEETPLVAPTIASTAAAVLIVTVLITTVLTIVSTVLTVVSTILAVVSAILTVVAITTNGKVNGVIDSSTLGNWHDDRLMVPSRGDGRQPVCTSGETLGEIGGELAASSSSVETLEESENAWVCGLRRVKRWDLFNDDVVVSDDLPSVVQLLRRSVVGVGSVGEGTGLHSSRIHDNSECGVGLDITTIGRKLKLDRRHVVDTRDVTHRRRVARATLNLLAVREGLADAKADEVVSADEGVCFTVRQSLTIDVLNDGGVQSKGGLRVRIRSTTTVVVVIVAAAGLVVVAAALVVVPATLVVIPAVLVVIATVLAIAVAAILAVAVTAILTVAVAAEPIVLTGYKAIRLRDEEGNGELGNDKKNEREL